jgi:hypothetical protein
MKWTQMVGTMAGLAAAVLSLPAGGQSARHAVDVRGRDTVSIPVATPKPGHFQVLLETSDTAYTEDNPLRLRLTIVSTNWAYDRAGTMTVASCAAVAAAEPLVKSLLARSAPPPGPHAVCASFGARVVPQDVKLGRKWTLKITNESDSVAANVHANVTITPDRR